MTSVASTTPAGTTTDSFAYNEIGQTTTRKTGGSEQKLDWDGEGHVTKVTEAGKTTEYLYDANGNRLIRRDPTGTTLYLDGEELKLTTSGALEPTRYYAFGGTTVAIRDQNGLSWVAGDEQGTSQVSVGSDTLDVTRRRQAPFGAPRGATTAFPGQKGFVGGTIDASTGLAGVGARLYDAAVGRFLSADPLLDVDDPQQMQGYSYANNNPILFLDPSGLSFFSWAWKAFDDHTGAIGLALGVAGMVLAPGLLLTAVVVVGLAVNAYDLGKSIADGDGVGIALGVAGFVTGGLASKLKGVAKAAGSLNDGAQTAKAVDASGAAALSDLTSQGAGSASAGIAEAKNIQSAREAPAKEAEARAKAAKEHADDLAADIDRMLNSGCPAMKGVVPLPGPCPVAEGQPDPMKNKYCADGGSGANFLGCLVFGADWRRPSYNFPIKKPSWPGVPRSWINPPQQTKPRVPRNDPYPQYSGYHTTAYLDMKYR